MKKRSILSVVVLLVLAVQVIAQEPNSGNDFEIRQNAQGTITITGYTGSRTQVVIPETIEGIRVTEIGSRAFAIGKPVAGNTPNEMMARIYDQRNPEPDRKEISSVVIPNTVTRIGDQAFFGQSLTTVSLSTSLTTIGNSAFFGNRLTSIAIPNSVTLIGEDAFANNSLISVTFGNRIETLGARAFADNKLTTISLPASLKTLVESINRPYYQSVQEMQYSQRGTFLGNNIQTITLPANAKFSLNWIGNNFIDFYQSQNRKAGTYTWSGRVWTVQ